MPVTYPRPAALSGMRDLVSYGADPLGVRDSTDAIQSALEDCGSILAPPGVYMVSGTLHGYGGTHVLARGATFKASPDLTGTLLQFVNQSDVSLDGLTVDMNYTETVEAGAPGNQVGLIYEASVAGIAGLRLRGVSILNGWHYGLYIVGVSGNQPSGIYVDAESLVDNCGNAGLSSDCGAYILNATAVRFAGKATNNSGQGLAFGNCTDVTLENAECTGNTGEGASFVGSSTTPSSDLRVVGGKYSNNGGLYGLVFSQHTSQITCVGGRSDGQTAGGGLGLDLTAAADTLYDAEAVISGWQASNNSAHGLYLNNLTGVTVAGGIFSNNGEPGIGAVLAGSVITGVLCSGNTDYGLALYAGTGVTTGGNEIGPITGTGNVTALVSDAGTTASNYMATTTTPPT